MANNAKQYEYFVGFRYSEVPLYLASEVRKGVYEGYLRIDETRIIRAVQPKT